jgi:hypothetical protein
VSSTSVKKFRISSSKKTYRLVHLSPLVLLMVTCENVITSIIPSIKVEESIPTFHYQIKYEMG